METRLDPATALARLGGVARRRDILALTTRHRLEGALADGKVVRLGRSMLGLPGATSHLAAAKACGGVLAGLSAAQHWRWQVKSPPQRPVVIVPRNRSRGREGIDIRRLDLAPGQVRGHVLGPAHTVVDCARTLPLDEALSVADSALRSGRVTRRDLERACALLPRPARASRVLELADPRAANPFESVPRAIALDVPGLHLVPQENVDGIGHGDLVDRALRIVVECESWQFHSPPRAFRYDVRRYTRMTLAGWTVVRLVWEDVMHRPDEVRRMLVEAATLARRRGFRPAPA
jgi:very-short-patch-repair endonuclease